MFYTVRGKASATRDSEEEPKDLEKILAIIEVVIMIFIVTFIPGLIKLGRPPQSLEEVWIELLVALLASAYAYMRMRGIEPPPTE